MVALSALPINSITWLMGALACLALFYRSYNQYRHSANELSKYLAWFGLVMGLALVLLAAPAFFTQDPDALRLSYLAGEFFVYGSLVAQAAVLWCLILRSKLPLWAATVPVGLASLAAWLYAIPRSTLSLDGNFITYRDPLASTIIMGILLLVMFVPVGVYFLRAATKQAKLKGILTSTVLGIVYVAIGISTGGNLLLAGQVMTRPSAIGDLVFFSVLLLALAWPHRATAAATARTS